MKNNHIETKKQQQKTTKVALREETSSEEGSDNDDAECIFCKDTQAISGQPEVKDGYVVHHAQNGLTRNVLCLKMMAATISNVISV